MLTATVVGNVWSTRRLAEIPNGAFLEVEAEGTGTRFVAFDVLGSGVGERVLVAQGSVAAAWFPGKPPPIDALIVGSIDEPASEGSGGSRPRASASGGSGGSPPRASTVKKGKARG
jgi:microcompartment protein CcmK/EutM